MLSTDQYIMIKCPSLYADANKSLWVQAAKDVLGSCFYGEWYGLAVALRAAHDYTLDNRIGGQGFSGPISSIKEKNLSVSFQTTGGDSNPLSQTSYGLELQELMNKMTPFIRCTGETEDLCN